MSSSPVVATAAELPMEMNSKDPASSVVARKAAVDGGNAGPKARDTSTTAEEEGAPRDQRRRLKKLRKRAARFCPQTDLSGILKRDEWDEVKALMPPTEETNNDKDHTYVPWIGMRQTKKHKNARDKARDGFDHRYTLKYVLQPQTSNTSKEKGNRKRPREEQETPSLTIPSWICLHNPVCVDHVAVLEVHLSTNNSGDKLKQEDVTAVMENCLGPENAYPTKWFEGPRPQSISDVLLYEKPPQPSRKKAKQPQLDGDLSKEEAAKQLLEELKSFTLSEEDLKKEGYPFAVEENDEKQPQQPNYLTTISNEFRQPTSIPLEEARSMVQSVHEKVADQKFPFVRHPPNINNNDTSPRIFGLDCEMVQTANGKELGRVTLIEYNNTSTATATDFQDSYQVLMDELVLPYPPILDYVTAYSGITAKLLENVTTRLEQIQASILTYIRPHDIVVGHSLENDLLATQWIHPTVIDTAVLFRASNGNGSSKYSLKHLSNILLHKRMQDGAHHCSEEDAAATLELAIKRAEEGPSFTIHPKDKQWWIPASSSSSDSATVFIGPGQWLNDNVTRHNNTAHALTCEDIEHPNTKAILSWLTGKRRRAGLVWANLVLSQHEHLKVLEALLTDLKAKLSTNTVLMVNFQPGYTTAEETSQRRRVCMNPKTTLSWSDEDEKHCRGLVEECRVGKMFWVTNHPGPS